jgi:hypothetical protein
MPNFQLVFKEKLIFAYCEMIFLLDHGYPKRSVLNFIANHYNLEKKFRNILNRAALSVKQVKVIKEHLILDTSVLSGKNIYIDAYNQLSTFFSLKNHDPIIICRDGVFRDIFSSIHGKKNLRVDREFLSSYLRIISELNANNIIFYFDKQRSHSRDHANTVTEIFQTLGILGTCKLVSCVDKSLKEKNQGIVFSHDSAVLEVVPYCFDFNSWYIRVGSKNTFPQKMFLNFQAVECS